MLAAGPWPSISKSLKRANIEHMLIYAWANRFCEIARTTDWHAPCMAALIRSHAVARAIIPSSRSYAHKTKRNDSSNRRQMQNSQTRSSSGSNDKVWDKFKFAVCTRHELRIHSQNVEPQTSTCGFNARARLDTARLPTCACARYDLKTAPSADNVQQETIMTLRLQIQIAHLHKLFCTSDHAQVFKQKNGFHAANIRTTALRLQT